MKAPYNIAKFLDENKQAVEYFSFPGQFIKDKDKAMKFVFPPVLHLADVKSVHPGTIEIVSD